MAVGIRLRRTGNKNRPYYQVIATDTRRPRNGRFLERLGHYDPLPSPPVFQVNRERLEYWLGKGAKPSDTVRELVEKYGKQEQSAAAPNA